MKLSTKGRYGLSAMIDLAVYSENEAVSLNSIAERQHISEGYLEQLMAKLKKAGLVTSIRGASGGYRLARPAAEVSVGDILRALEGSLKAVECPGEQANGCEESSFCVTKYVWERMNASIQKTVDDIKLSDLINESRRVKKTTEIHTTGKTNEPCARSEKS